MYIEGKLSIIVPVWHRCSHSIFFIIITAIQIILYNDLILLFSICRIIVFFKGFQIIDQTAPRDQENEYCTE